MRLTTKTRYAIRAMAELGKYYSKKPVSLKEIARRQGIKIKYLEQIFLRLHKSGLVKSTKGPGGGYSLRKEPKAIRLSEIVSAVSETIIPVFCVDKSKSSYCPRSGHCLTQPFWKKLKRSINNFFQSYTLGDIIKQKSRIDG